MKRLYLSLCCLCLAVTISAAQSPKRKKPAGFNKQNDENIKFLEKQFWLGIKGGTNLAGVTVTQQYNIISPTNYNTDLIKKRYDRFKQLGSQISLELTYYYKGFSFSFQPTYQTINFVYTNSYEWVGEEEGQFVQLDYEQNQKVNYIQLPLLIKYEFTGNKLRPYIQAGFYQSILSNATKEVTIKGIDNASGGVNEFENEPITIGATDLFAKYHYGLIGGGGVYYNVGNVRLNLDIQYQYGLSNISSVENRYSSDRLNGVGDAMDDLTLDNAAISIGCMFPMRFLESGFKSLDKK